MSDAVAVASGTALQLLQLVELSLDLRDSDELHFLLTLQLADLFDVVLDDPAEGFELSLKGVDANFTAVPLTAIRPVATIGQPSLID